MNLLQEFFDRINNLREMNTPRRTVESPRDPLPAVTDPRRVTHIVVHTAAHLLHDGTPGNTSAEDIDRWHRARGWSGIGYHAVVRLDGDVEGGRPAEHVGAHVKGFNRRSLGVCLSGHGDYAPPTEAQFRALVRLVADWIEERRYYGLIDAFFKNPSRVLGHREVWTLRLVPKPIRKTCPGRLVDMTAIRKAVLAELRGRGYG